MNRHKAKYKGFSLIEVLVALVTAVMTLIAVFAIYDRARRVSQSVTQKLDEHTLPSEILQKIAEDIDRIASPGSDAKITVANSFQSGFPAAQLTVTSQIIDKDNNPQILEKVVWQTSYDIATGRLILYRSHSGLIWEDNLLDKAQRGDWSPDRQLFVPLCAGLSYFKIQIPPPQDLTQKADVLAGRTVSQGQNLNDQDPTDEKNFADAWNQPQLPSAIRVTLSFAAPLEGRGVGGVEVPDEQKIKRTIVIDRSKKTNFVYVPVDANQVAAGTDANTVRNAANQAQGSLAPANSAAGAGQQPYSPTNPNRGLRFRPRSTSN